MADSVNQQLRVRGFQCLCARASYVLAFTVVGFFVGCCVDGMWSLFAHGISFPVAGGGVMYYIYIVPHGTL